MASQKCPICEAQIEIPAGPREGKRITCPNCYAQLGIHRHKGKWVLGCAICKEPVFDPSLCEECERRHEKKRELLEEGRL